jgi:hypothetical protein
MDIHMQMTLKCFPKKIKDKRRVFRMADLGVFPCEKTPRSVAHIAQADTCAMRSAAAKRQGTAYEGICNIQGEGKRILTLGVKNSETSSPIYLFVK